MKILKFKKTSKDKYKLYLDNGDVISLYEDVIVNNNLLLKKEVDKDLVDELVKQNNDVHVYGMALNYISIRIRSKKELIDYLHKKEVSENLINDTITRLEKEGYINDFTFAKAYTTDQMTLTPKGPLKIKGELIKLGITDDITNEVIEDIDNNIVIEKLNNLLEKQIRIRKDSSNMLKLKLLNYFYNLGYEKEMILNELKNHKVKTDINKLQKEYNKLFIKYSKKFENNELEYVIHNKLYAKGYSKEDISKIKNED